MNNYMLLRIEGIQQSWGIKGKFRDRDTYIAPTKSGIIGMLGNAIGITDSNISRLEEFDRALMFAVRMDRKGVKYRDFQTAQNVSPVKKGGSSRGITFLKDYITGGSFVVCLQGEKGLLDEIGAALDNPKRTMFLGRRCCLPTKPIFITIIEANSFKEAFAFEKLVDKHDNVIVVQEETLSNDRCSGYVKDKIINAAKMRYTERYYVEYRMEV